MLQELKNIFNLSIKAVFKYWYLLLPVIFISEFIILVAKFNWDIYIFPSLSQLPISFLLSNAPVAFLTPFGKSLVAKLIYDREYQIITKSDYSIKNWFLIIFSIGVFSFLWFIGTVLGIMLLIVPGVMILIGLQVGTQAIIIENINWYQAIKRSISIIRKNIFTVFLLFIGIEISSMIITGLLTMPFSNLTIYQNWQIKFLIDAAIGMIAGSFVYIPLAYLYLTRSDIERKNGYFAKNHD
jgi:hypothetical protein